MHVHRASTSVDWFEASALLHEHVEWMRLVAGFDPLEVQPSLRDELGHLDRRYGDADHQLFLARARGVAVGVVALRCHGRGEGELKRMYVRPVARGSGVADRLVSAVVDAAAGRCCGVVWLETLRGSMDRAAAVYRRNGFVDAPARARTLPLSGVVVMERRVEPVARCA